MTRIVPGDGYVTGVLPGVVVFGLGLTLVATPVTATVLAAADQAHAGIASGINNAVARVANLLAVAALPLVANLGGERFYQPAAMTHGFHIAMAVAAGLSIVGGIIAWFTISDDALRAEPKRRGQPPGVSHRPNTPARSPGRPYTPAAVSRAWRTVFGKPAGDVPDFTDEARRLGVEDVGMASIWVILAGAVGALNARLLAPGVAAFFGFGK